MSRQRLIKQLKQKNSSLNHSELESVIEIFTKSILTAFKNGKNVELRGFGRWYLKRLKENFNARNPSTYELIYKPERIKVIFKSSKKLNQIINK